ncbi:hypothetical protein [Bizionia arctica]|nr:hypothetical protein [Bizionia arctica]
MKNILLKISVIVLVLSFSACSSDDNEMSENESSTIQGVWGLTKVTLETPIDVNNDGVFSDVLFEAPGFLAHSNIEILDDSNGTIFFSEEITYNTRMEDGNLIMMVSSSTRDERDFDPITYTLSGGIGAISLDNVESSFLINGNTLLLTIENGFIAKDMDTNVVTINQNITYTFIRS